MGKIAFVFPGQGSQYVGMGKDLCEHFESAQTIMNEFNTVLGKDLSKLCFEGPEEDLKQTINTQPAILAVSIICLELFKEKSGIKADYVAGHSLGEYPALYTAGVLSLNDAAKLVQKRAELMSQAQTGGMSAILGMDDEKLSELISQASVKGQISVANYNTPDQTVITGESVAIAYANEIAPGLGAKRVIPLAVSGAFHSSLMKSASEQFAQFVAESNVNDATIPVITNVDAKATQNAAEFKIKMVNQIYSSVFWKQTIAYMLQEGVDTFIEIGPDKVLSGMIKKIDRSAKVFNVSDIQSLETVINSLNSEVLV